MISLARFEKICTQMETRGASPFPPARKLPFLYGRHNHRSGPAVPQPFATPMGRISHRPCSSRTYMYVSGALFVMQQLSEVGTINSGVGLEFEGHPHVGVIGSGRVL